MPPPPRPRRPSRSSSSCPRPPAPRPRGVFLPRLSIRDKLQCSFQIRRLETGSDTFPLPFPLSALADYISSDRSAMMRELKRMREEGLVDMEGRRVTLPPQRD